MPDPNPNPPAATETTPSTTPKPIRQRADINQGWLDEISATEKLAVVATKDGYAATLAKRKIDGAFLAKLDADLKQARKLTGQATSKSTGKKLVTQDEQAMRAALLLEIQGVQSAAKQKFTRNKAALADYYVGQNVKAMSRAALEASATNILAKAKDAGLPGIETAELKTLEDVLAAYTGVETEQAGEQASATTTRVALKQLIDAIADQRHQLQFAADGLWPAGKAENAGIRREFGLPADKAFKG